MHADESQPVPDSPATASLAAQSPGLSPPEVSSMGAAHWLPLWILTLGAGLVCGLISWVGGETTFNRFPIKDEIVFPPDYDKIGGYQKQAVSAQIQGDAVRIVEKKKATVSFGLLGLVLALSLGAVGGIYAASARDSLAGMVLGTLVGAGAGGGISWVVTPLFFRYQNPESGLLILFMTHAAIFGGIGAAAGLALGLGLGDRPAMVRAVFGGLLGALFGTIALESINSLAFPLMRTFEPIPSEPTPRLVEYVCVAVCTALFAGLAAGKPTTKPAPLPPV
jgi:hypothetical protein